jgi:hypothetical protein
MIVSVLAFINSFSYPVESTIYVRFILAVFFILSAVLFFTKSEGQRPLKDMFTTKRAKAIALMVVYVILVPIVGFFVSTFIFTIAFMYTFNNKGIVKYIIISFVFVLIVYGVFDVLLNIWFPTGLLI